ncbi:unnamed protein product [Penicillium salamii]|nr:unnamed protein product [Penicillium salamii]
MGENAKPEITQAERDNRWEMAYNARMRQIIPGLFLGNVEASYKQQMLQETKINAIVSRLCSICMCADSSTQDLLVYMSDICEFINRMAAPALFCLHSLPVECGFELNDERPDLPSKTILSHCELGISRSPTIIIANLMRKLNIQQADAFDLVRQKQKIRPSKNLTRQLQVCGECRFQVWENEDRTVPKPASRPFLKDWAHFLWGKALTNCTGFLEAKSKYKGAGHPPKLPMEQNSTHYTI